MIIVGKQSKPYNFDIQRVPLELLAYFCNHLMQHARNPISRLGTIPINPRSEEFLEVS